MRPPIRAGAAVAALALTGALTAYPPAGLPDGTAAVDAAGSTATIPPDAARRRERRVTPGFFAPSPGSLPTATEPTSGTLLQRGPDRYHEFYFTRAIYSDWRGGGRRYGEGRFSGGSWSVDYPEADQHFTIVARRLGNLDAYEGQNAVALDDPELRRFPFLYALEVGRGGGMNLSDAEVRGLRDYLTAGGFLVIDDFWGTRDWANFEREITRVLPGRPIVDIPMDHTLFRIFYDIEEILQVPSINNARRGQTWEQDGYVPHVRGIFDDQGRPMVVINWNTDLGDAWEWADDPWYPLTYSTFAFEMGMNMVMYAMTH